MSPLRHESLKSSLAFRKPATAVASRRPGRADDLMVGLDGHASLSAGRAPWRDGQAFLPPRRRPEGKVCRRRRQNDAVRPALRAADQPIVDRRTQTVACTECDDQQSNGQDRAWRAQQHHSGSRSRQHWGVTADCEVGVGRRRSHRADAPRSRPQCPGSPPCPWLGPPWSLVP